MSAFLDCIRRAVDAGATDRERAEATQEQWRRAADEYAQRYDRRTAEEMAYEDVLEAGRRDTAIQRHQRLAALRVMRKHNAEIRSATSLKQVGMAKMESLPGRRDQVESVRFKQDAILAMANGMATRYFSEVNPTITEGISKANVALNHQIGRELRGESSGNPVAKAMADSIMKGNEFLRTRANEAGFHIEKLEDWGFRQSYNWRRIDEAGEDAFIRTIAPELFDRNARGRLDWSRIENYATGRPFSEASDAVKRSFLQDVFRSGTRSIYAPVVEPRYGPPVFGQKSADKHAHQRILHYRSYDDWQAVNEAFDGPDLFSTITNHYRSMARDIALAEEFGPNVRFGVEHMLQVIRDEANKRDLARGDGKKIELRSVLSREPVVRAMMDQLTGLSATPEGPTQAWVANFFSNVRGFNVMSLLGSAVIASGGDFASTRMLARAMRINPSNIFANYTRLMAEGMTSQDAMRGSHIADSLTSYGAGMARFQGEVPGSELISRGSGFIMRAQGLTRHTEALRMATRWGVEGAFAEAREKGLRFADLPEFWQRRLGQRGMTEEDWQALTDPRFQFEAANGAKFVNPHYWLQVTDIDPVRAQRIATTAIGFIEEAAESAVPTRTVLGDAVLTAGTRPGTALGEFTRSAKQFKSFAINTLLTQFGLLIEQPTPWSRAQYLAGFALWFGFLGAASLQLKELVKGNDPRPMDTVSFWGAAALQGGGFGVIGDLLSASETRMGGGVAGWIGGPVVGLSEDVLSLTAGNIMQAIRQEDTNFGRELSKMIGDRTPFSSYFPIRTAWDRLVADQIQQFLDPEAVQSMTTSARNQMRDYGNGSWWGRGQALPSRAPDLSALNPLGQ